MKIQTVAGIRTISGEPPRSTAYYYADLERLKRKNVPSDPNGPDDTNGQSDLHEPNVPNDSDGYNDRDNSTGRSDQYTQNLSGRNDSNGRNCRDNSSGRNDLYTQNPSGRNDSNGRDNSNGRNELYTQSPSGRNDSIGRNCRDNSNGRNDLYAQNLSSRNDSNIRNCRDDSNGRNNAGHNGRNDPNVLNDSDQNPNELSEYVESNEVVNDGAIREVPPLRDRQWSLPEYSTPENRKPEETYSTAGTFPMPEPKEKEPLLAELEIVGRVPLTQLGSSSGVRRSRSWYLCCPNVGDEEVSRDSSWRYSSLRPVTAPPMPGQNGLIMVASQSSGRAEDPSSLRAERDSLARALSAERQRAAAAARAHDARLAELHGVIAELVRRRAADKHAGAIPEEDVSDECESTTQPAGELDGDADRSRTEQNDTSSILSPLELPTPQERTECRELPDDTTDTSTQEICRAEPRVTAPSPTQPEPEPCESCLQLSERDSQLCLTTARCCQSARHGHTRPASADSGAREHGSTDDTRVYTAAASPGRCESRQAKLASRVRLRRAGDCDSTERSTDQAWCAEAAERLALDVCAQADLREALVTANNDGSALSATVCAWRARCARLEGDCRVLQCALARATDTAHRLSCACAVQESSCVSLCCALRAADRALETYDVLLALAETCAGDSPEREAAERVARQLLARLDAEQSSAVIGEPLLSPGPWLQHDCQGGADEAWSAACEARLRGHAARLKADTVTLRSLRPPPHLFSFHDTEEDGDGAGESGGDGEGDGDSSQVSRAGAGAVSMVEMEAAVMMQEVLAAREARAARAAACAGMGGAHRDTDHTDDHKESQRSRGRRRRERHWLDARAAETDL